MKEKVFVDMFTYENSLLAEGVKLVCGVDEAGRGPLAGPVCAGAFIPDLSKIVDGVNDSKKLTPKKRDYLYDLVKESAISSATAFVAADVIDEINILEATKLAMRNAVAALTPEPEAALVDAVKLDLPVRVLPIIHGDALSYSIAAASILAKVERDRLMLEYAEKYPEYGFESHKGYGSAHHIEMLRKYGPCPIHRATFIKNFFK